ncbi:hypothetical protein LIER_36476 [Lithospermum erythrorhizon]|uniref:WAT1-related protein n=1 Tax=Lithospermum erythrorhizon TaxID=34254 RepID=A0AAV3P7V8_LITER
MKDLGKTKNILGMEITRDRAKGKLWLSQEKYVLKGIVTSSISYYVQGIVMKSKGPVFATAFSPLMMIIVAIMGSFILAEKIFLGGMLGAALIVVGLYAVLWGKYKEEKEANKMESFGDLPETIKDTHMDVISLEKTGNNVEMNGLGLQEIDANGHGRQVSNLDHSASFGFV